MNEASRRWLFGAAVFLLLFWMIGSPLLVTFVQALSRTPSLDLAGVADPAMAASAALPSPFVEFAERPGEWAALGRSLWISIASVVLSAAVGVPLAFLFARTDFPGRRTLGELLALPVALPPLVGVIAFLYLYGESGFATKFVA